MKLAPLKNFEDFKISLIKPPFNKRYFIRVTLELLGKNYDAINSKDSIVFKRSLNNVSDSYDRIRAAYILAVIDTGKKFDDIMEVFASTRILPIRELSKFVTIGFSSVIRNMIKNNTAFKDKYFYEVFEKLQLYHNMLYAYYADLIVSMNHFKLRQLQHNVNRVVD